MSTERQSLHSPDGYTRKTQFAAFRSSLASILAVLLLISLASVAAAQSTRTWDGSENDNWRDDGNWTGGSSPTADRYAIMNRGVSRNNINLANSSGNDGNRQVYALQLRTRGNGTVIDDYFGANQDLFVNWRFRRGQIQIPSNSGFSAPQILSWVDTRSSSNEMAVFMDLDLPAGNVIFTGEGEGGYSGDPGSTNSVEILNFYGNLTGAATVTLDSQAFSSSSPYRSRLVLHEDTEFTGQVTIEDNGELYLRNAGALDTAAVLLLEGGILDIQGIDPIFADFQNRSTLDMAGRTLGFGSRADQSHNGTYSGTGNIVYVGTHIATFRGANTFSGLFVPQGPVVLTNENAWRNATVRLLNNNTLSFTTPNSFMGGLEGSGSAVINGNLLLDSSAINATYSGALSGSGTLQQQNATNWTYNGTSTLPFAIASGTLSGTGTMAFTAIGADGAMTPGASDAVGQTGVQRFEELLVLGEMITDINSASDLDQVQVTGELRFNGATLNVRNTTFPSTPVIIATYGSQVGVFDTITGLPADVDVRYSWNDAVRGTSNNIALVPNIAPTAVNDSYTVTQDGFLSGDNVLDNDNDGDFDALTVTTTGQFVAGGVGGTVTLDAAGNLTFTPAPAAVGDAIFSYTVEDNNGAQATATVTIQIQNVQPVANTDVFGLFEDNALSGVNILDNDQDTAFDTLAVINAGTFTAGGIGGSVTMQSNGQLSYTPPMDANGTAFFDYQIQDSAGAQATSSVTLNVTAVNDAPSFTAVNPPTLNEDATTGPIVISLWASFDPGPGDEASQSALGYTVSNLSNPDLLTGTPVVTDDGGLIFTLTPDAFGTTDFDVAVQDDGGTNNGGVDTSATQTFTITISAVNDAPDFFANLSLVANEDDGEQTIANWASFDPGADNESGQSVDAYLISNVSDLSLFTAGPVVDSSGNLTYTLADNANGAVTFEVQVRDDGGTVNGGQDTSAAQTVTLTISPRNDAPSFSASDPATILEDASPQTLSGWATFDPGPDDESDQGVLTYSVDNISDPTLFSAAPIVDVDGNLSYTPAADANGISTFDVVVQDDGGTDNQGVDLSATQTFTITVVPVNDQPSFEASDPPTLDEDAGGFVQIPGWASYDPGAANESFQVPEFWIVSNISNEFLFSITPMINGDGDLTFSIAEDANGSSTFDVRVTDGGGSSNGGQATSEIQTFTVTVNPVNDAPSFTGITEVVATEDAGAQTVVDWASFDPGPDNESDQAVDAYLVSNISEPSLFATGPVIDVNGELSYTTAPDANGFSTFDVRVRDDGGIDNGGIDTSALQSFSIVVVKVNDAPSLSATDPSPVTLGAGAQEIPGWAVFNPGASNESGQAVQAYTVSNISNPALFDELPTVDQNGDLRYTPNGLLTGTSTFDVQVRDDGGTANGGNDTSPLQTFTIVVRSPSLFSDRFESVGN